MNVSYHFIRLFFPVLVQTTSICRGYRLSLGSNALVLRFSSPLTACLLACRSTGRKLEMCVAFTFYSLLVLSSCAAYLLTSCLSLSLSLSLSASSSFLLILSRAALWFLCRDSLAGETDEEKLRQVFGPFGQIQDVSFLDPSSPAFWSG